MNSSKNIFSKALLVILVLSMSVFTTGCDSEVNSCECENNPATPFVAVIRITDLPTSMNVGNIELTGKVEPQNATNKTHWQRG